MLLFIKEGQDKIYSRVKYRGEFRGLNTEIGFVL
jgi:hypothetical protein